VGDVEIAVLLLVAAAVVAVSSKFVRVSYTLALLLFGLVVGLFVPAPTLNSDIILLLFLPPLLFEAAFVLDLASLWSVRAGVLVFALPGVLLATAVAGFTVHQGLGLPWTIALTFGAIVAATDPVAVLATFRQLRVDHRLASVVEGESLLNDGIALVLIVTLIETVESGFHADDALLSFVLSVAGGTLIGVALGWTSHLLIAKIHDHLTEMSVSVAVAYGAFLAAEVLHLSGVLATIAAAMTLGQLGRSRGWIYSDGSERMLTDLWEFLAFIANAGLFLLIGLTVSTAGLADHPGEVVWGVAAALVGRLVVAYGLGSLLDRLRFPLSRGERHLLFWGGLRGAVALAAALSLPVDFPHRDQVLAMTYGAVIFTLIVQGATIGPLVRRLKLAAPEA
jgi:monovalent cation:H+ antiporter, CPA1 family